MATWQPIDYSQFTGFPGYARPGREQGYLTTSAGPSFGIYDPTRGFLAAKTALNPELRGQVMDKWYAEQAAKTPAISTPPAGEGGIPGAGYKPGPITSVINDLLTAAISGKGGPSGGLGPGLHSLATGVIPSPLAEQIRAETAEGFGGMGARFGTDFERVLSQSLATAGAQQQLAALREILGLGTEQAGLEQRGELGSLQALLPLLGLLQGTGATPS
jgi:hypothetical protein